jgi:hypothetical protein
MQVYDTVVQAPTREAFMTRISATYDGSVLHLDEPLPLPPNTRVVVTVETRQAASPPSRSFFRTASSLRLEGPPDWSERIDEYLYGDAVDDKP